MNAHIHLTQNFSETEYFILQLDLDRQLYIICKRDDHRIHRIAYVDPDTVDKCVEACKWLIAFYPDHTEQIERILSTGVSQREEICQDVSMPWSYYQVLKLG